MNHQHCQLPAEGDPLLHERLNGPLGTSARLFFDGHDREFADAQWAIRKLQGAEMIEQRCSPGGQCWMLTFRYAGYVFAIDTNTHGTTSLYFVNDPLCPDEVLLSVVRHFDRYRRRRDCPLIVFAILMIALALAFVAVSTQ